jgi:hypothetical protein
LLRHLFDALMARAKGRRRSAEHERAWLNLAGWCLRPGFGAPLDDWRIGQLWALFDSGAQYAKDSQVRAEWWTLWRRGIAGVWLNAILALDWKKVDPAAFAAVQIARMTGDRSRDLPEDLRLAVVRRLEAANAPRAWITMVSESVELDNADEGRVFGESLPAGLKLIAN